VTVAKKTRKPPRATITIRRLDEVERRLKKLEQEVAEVARKACESYVQTMRIGGSE
jgi:hypothetical protein